MINLICLPGWTYDTSKWQPLIKELSRLKLNSKLLNVPGLTAPLDRPWELDDYVSWLNKQISKLPKTEVSLLAHSNGGRIALAYCLKYPHRIKRLILVDGAGLQDNRLVAKLKRNLFKLVAKAGKKFIHHPLARNWLYKLAGTSDYQQASPVMKKTMKNLIAVDLTHQVANVSIPCLIIWGADDQIIPVWQGRLLADSIPSGVFELIPGAKHSPHFTHYKTVAKLTYKFLQT